MSQPRVIRLTPTYKQQQFAQKYIELKGNGTQAALAVYDTKDPRVAQTVASENLSKPIVQQTIDQLAQKLGLNQEKILDNFGKVATKEPELVTTGEFLKANIELAKILRMYPDKKSTHLRLDVKTKVNSMDYNEAKRAYDSVHGEASEFVVEAEE